MQLSLENALDLFRGRRDNRSPVLLFLDNDQALVKIRGTVAEVVEDEIVVVDDAARVRLGLKQAEFHYEVTGEHRAGAMRRRRSAES